MQSRNSSEVSPTSSSLLRLMSISNFQTNIIFDIVFHTRCLLPPRSSPTGRRTCSGCPGARRTGCSTGRPGGPPARASGTVRSRISILSRSVCQQQQQQSLYQVTQHYLCTVSGCVDRRIQECPLLPASVRQGWRPRVPLQRRWQGRTSASVGYSVLLIFIWYQVTLLLGSRVFPS